MSLRPGPLLRGHRCRLREILDATRAFEAEEIEVALSLFDESYDDCGPDGSADRTNGTAPYEYLGSFTDEGDLAGYICFGPTPGADRGYDIYWIAVHPEYQRGGGGAGLLAHTEQSLRNRGARLLLIETSSREEYAATRRFYEDRGYEPSARISDFYAHGDHRVLYTKRLTDHHTTDSGVAEQ